MLSNRFNKNAPISIINRYGGKKKFIHLYDSAIRKLAVKNDCNVFVDFFGGAASVCIYALNMKGKDGKPLFSKVIYNDIDPSMCAIMRTVKDKAKTERLIGLLLKVKYSKGTFEYAHRTLSEIKAGEKKADDMTVAFLSIIESRMSFNSACNSFKGYKNKYEQRKLEYAFYRAALNLKEAPEYLERLEVFEGSYIDLIHRNINEHIFDYNRSVLFFDPPYASFERSAKEVYHDELGILDHVVLIQALSFLKHWILCGYQGKAKGYLSRIYGILDDFRNIRKHDLGAMHRPSSGKRKSADDPHEILWVKA